ncbi:MAG: hypothetical protein ACK4S6_14010 [Roseateles asaccharophilus]|jgi:hypothetical protein|uniref:Uncharacterized protein n=1 Tax=Roseateles asaccharophilus TaxID=582607 RepID=A0A4R6NB91_9BURK|nr:hypothetical protein [Roseateles asaccharophilus]MDN3546654.1 hypothetical protein [Roseateles asaccharophilus]TDP12878.1 hypothetical protein DFR39_101352 [Roseateles asaccharophilus]
MAWIPIALFTFKILVFGTGMYFAIKWHYDKGRKRKQALLEQQKAAQGQTGGA